jgi:hypothetical protein
MFILIHFFKKDTQFLQIRGMDAWKFWTFFWKMDIMEYFVVKQQGLPIFLRIFFILVCIIVLDLIYSEFSIGQDRTWKYLYREEIPILALTYNDKKLCNFLSSMKDHNAVSKKKYKSNLFIILGSNFTTMLQEVS